MARSRVGAIIIKDKKILLLTDENKRFYWTPGGKAEANETAMETLSRELDEELSIQLKNPVLYHGYRAKAETFNGYETAERDHEYYFVDLDGEINMGAEIKEAVWADRVALETLPVLVQTRENLISKLMEDGYL